MQHKILSLFIWLIAAGACSDDNVRDKSGEETQQVAPRIADFFTEYIPEIEVNEYGLATKDLQFATGHVERFDNLARILGRYEVPYPTIHMLAESSDNVFNLNHIRRGNDYKLFYRKTDTASIPVCWIYHKNASEYVAFYLNGEKNVRTGKLPVETKERKVGGVINSSLYMTLLDQGVSTMLALELSEVFAWQVDFFRIEQGDQFRIVFEEEYVRGERIGLGNIRAAYFQHRGSDYYAFRFDQNGRTDYFDRDGQSLRKEFLKAPLNYSRISSGYTNRRFHPVLGEYRPHYGIDYAAPTGTPIYAIGDGIVTEASRTRGNGNYVKIRHNSTYTTQYLHMSRFASGIRPGTKVEQKDVIGYVGQTGLATGPHLCFRFYRHGSPVNPRSVEAPPTDPVEEKYLDAFSEVRDEYLTELRSIGLQQASLQ